MKKVPFTVKIAVSTVASIGMCRKLWNNNLYEAELYAVAIKYRPKFDKRFKEIEEEMKDLKII
jgi:hypothetical protein